MADFEINTLSRSSVLQIYSQRDVILVDPPYQRMGDIWPLDKRQLLIDSIINQFDIPKIYLHNIVGQKYSKKGKYRYSIIDGRQRLESIWGFINGDFALSDSVEYLQDPSVNAQGLTYDQLSSTYPQIRQLFDATPLSVFVVHTEDIDLIEEMFSRLNEAVPLNASEKRNAYGGPLPAIFRKVAEHDFFSNRIKISNRRYQYRDVAAKLMLIEHSKKIVDTKKIYLDEFVKSNKTKNAKDFSATTKRVTENLSSIANLFGKKDSLLRSSGMIVVYYWVIREAREENWRNKITRNSLLKFENMRTENRDIAEKNIAKANYDLLEFDRLMQTPNDAYAIRLRVNILANFLKSGRAKSTIL